MNRKQISQNIKLLHFAKYRTDVFVKSSYDNNA